MAAPVHPVGLVVLMRTFAVVVRVLLAWSLLWALALAWFSPASPWTVVAGVSVMVWCGVMAMQEARQ